VEVLKGNTQVD